MSQLYHFNRILPFYASTVIYDPGLQLKKRVGYESFALVTETHCTWQPERQLLSVYLATTILLIVTTNM